MTMHPQAQNRKLTAHRSLPNDDIPMLPRKGFMVTHVTKADLRPKNPPIYNQGDKGSCTAHGHMRCFEYNQMLILGEDPAGSIPTNSPWLLGAAKYTPGSRELLYELEGVVEGHPGQDDGAQITTGGIVFQKYGCAPESIRPYEPDSTGFLSPATAQQLKSAAQYKLSGLPFRLQDLRHIKESLIDGFPVVCGLTLYDSFMAQYMGETGIGQVPRLGEQVQGGHCVTIVGFDENDPDYSGHEAYLFANSWGTDWGMQGFFKLPKRYLQETNLFFDPLTYRP